MSYANTTIQQIYEVTRSGKSPTDKLQLAMAWLEADNIMRVRALVCRWFDLMQAGEAENRYPDPKWRNPPHRPPLTQELADRVISEMDEDFQIEAARFPDGNPDAGPGFYRLPPHARMAICQLLYSYIKSESELEEEASTRLKAGEHFPPDNYVPVKYEDFV